MIDKITDAASMLWLNLDSRERMLLVCGAALVCVIVLDTVTKVEREKTEDRIARRAADLLRGSS